LELPEKKSSNVKDVVELAILITIVVGGVVGVNVALQAAMRTSIPIVVVDSGSMAPTLNVGDVCIIQNITPDQYVVGSHQNRTGDIIVYNPINVYPSLSEPVIHRIIAREYNSTTGHWWFLTEGDANSYPDPGWVEDSLVYGKVVTVIPWIGNIFLFLREGGIWWVILIIAVIVVVMIVQPASNVEKKFKEKVDSVSSRKKKVPQELISRHDS
jgi:signal peptidase I